MAFNDIVESAGFCAAMLLLFGAGATIFNKVEYGVHSVGTESCFKNTDDDTDPTLFCPFEKPWFACMQVNNHFSPLAH